MCCWHLTTARPCVSPRLLAVLYESFKASLCGLLHVSWVTEVATWRGLERWIGTTKRKEFRRNFFAQKIESSTKAFNYGLSYSPQEGRQALHCSLFCSNLPCLLCCLSFQQKHQLISVRPVLEEMWMSIWDTGPKTWEWGCGRHGNEDVGDMGMRIWDKELILTWNNRACRRLVYRPCLPSLTPGNRLQWI